MIFLEADSETVDSADDSPAKSDGRVGWIPCTSRPDVISVGLHMPSMAVQSHITIRLTSARLDLEN